MSKLTKEQFVNLLERYRKNNELVDKISEIFPTFWELDIVDFGWYMFDRVIEAYFEEEGADWISWWLYEKDGDPETKAYDGNKNEIPTETVDDLWNLVEEYRK